MALGVTVVSLAFAGCRDVPEKTNVVPPTPTPSPIKGQPVLKATNVSFDTYSKEWPVDWEFIDPDRQSPTRFDTKKAVLRLMLPKGKDIRDGLDTAPRYLKAIEGDFQIETKVKFHPALNYQAAGLLIWVDGQKYVRFERAYGGDGGGAGGLYFAERSAPGLRSIATTAAIPVEGDETWLRLVRSGNRFAAYWRTDPESEWREAGLCEVVLPPSVKAGLAAYNTASDLTVEFEYVRLLPLPQTR